MWILALLPAEGRTQPVAPCPPEFETLRYDENYSCLADPNARRGLLDAMKYIPLPLGSNSYLSLGGEARLRYDYKHNPTWGQDPQDPWGAFLQRYQLHADVHLGQRFRVFAQLRSALENGRTGEPSPVEEGELDVQQAFADLELLARPAVDLTLRLGRQEVRLGSERLVSVREGPNVRRRFDGGRGLLGLGDWDLSALAMYPAQNEDGVFQDGTNTDQALWGAYAVGPGFGVPGLRLDLYYLGFRDADATYAQGSGRETRHSLGARFWGADGGWDWNWEALYQFGRFAGSDIGAWTLASDTGYRLHELPWAPRLGLGANIASGDRDRDDGSLQTFNPLFPRGTYFDELGLLGPRNFFNVHPFLTVRPRPDLSLTADVDFFWRLSRQDGVYDPAGNLLRDGTGSDARYVSTLVSATSEWQFNRHLLLTLVYTHVFPGEFVRETGPHEDIDFVEVTAKLLF